MKTAVLYARYSTDMQNERSIEDQFAVCRRYAMREKLRVVGSYSDKAKSGATMFERDGLAELILASKKEPRPFDCVIVEAQDRLARDPEDSFYIFKRLVKVRLIEIHAANEGIVDEIKLHARSMISSLFLKDVADKVRRRFDGAAREGKIPGAVTYGYRRVLGKPGDREIDPQQAATVIRIFREYAAGVSPRVIALGLTKDGIPTFTGKGPWNHQTFIAGRYGAGMISNQLYIGKLVWNQRQNFKNPDNGKSSKRPAPADHLIVTDVPHLRIVDDELWAAAQAVRKARSVAKFGPDGKAVRRKFVPTSDDLFAGLLVCGACSGHMRVVNVQRDGSRRVGCAAAHQFRTCQHSKSYDLNKLRVGFLAKGREYLADPEYIREALAAFHEQFAEEAKAARGERIDAAKELKTIALKIERIVDAIENGDTAAKVLTKRLDELETRRSGLEARIRLLDAQANVVELHPLVLKRFVASMTKLFDTLLVATPESAETREAFRNVIRYIEVIPTPKCAPYSFRPYLRVGALAGVEMAPKRTTTEILAEHGVSTISVSGNPATAELPKTEQTVCLGTWRAAA